MNKRIPIVIGFLFLILAIWIQLTPVSIITSVLERLEHLAFDIQLRTLLITHTTPPTTSVAIIDIDDKSLQEIGRWPWPRSQIAALIQSAQEAGAVVIAFDVLFPEKETNIVDQLEEEMNKQKMTYPQLTPILDKLKPIFDYDSQLAETLKQGDVVLGMTFSPTQQAIGQLPNPVINLDSFNQTQFGMIIASGYIANIPILVNAAKNEGFVNVFADADGVIRRVPLFINYKNNLYPSLALEAVRVFLLSKVSLITAPYGDTLRLEGVRLGNHIIPTDNKSNVIIPFLGKSFTMPFYSATDVIHKKIPKDALQGKIIFVGTSATGQGDIHATSVESAYPGVEVHATIAHGILQDNFSYKPPWALGAEISVSVLLGLILIFIFPRLGPRTLGLIIVIIPAALLLINNEIWEKTGIILSILVPVVLIVILASVNIICGYLFETLRREHLKTMFGQYVPESHIDEMLKSSGKNYALQGEDRDMTVLFADIRNFTTISEPLSATELKNLLNEFLTPMTEIIFSHHGTIDKYVGDMIMAFWGAPLKDKKHAQHAISAALEMQKSVTRLQGDFAKRNWPEINIGIGINSGIMSVGDMGSIFRRNYTVLGDTVNLASRVESLTKFYGVKIMTTAATQKDQEKFVFRPLDIVRVKGKHDGIALFEVVCLRKELSPEKQKEIELSEQALNFYFKKEWESSRALFSELHKQYPDTLLYSLYLSRISEFLKNPPPADWNGIYIHTQK